jgi:hypothetical protein
VLSEWSSPPLAAWAIHRAELRGNARLAAFLEMLTSDNTSPAGQPLTL